MTSHEKSNLAQDEILLPPQTFLVGPTIYLRPIELADAQTVSFWDPNPFPVPPDLAEERLKESVPEGWSDGRRRLIACRISDDLPIASAEIGSSDDRVSDLKFHAGEVFPNDVRSRTIAEMIRLLVPWLLHEYEQMVVWARIPSGDEIVDQAAHDAGMTVSYRLREALLGPNGARRDEVGWQALHPTWLARLGQPIEPVFGEVDRETRSPARTGFKSRDADPPGKAMVVGERLYLRVIDEADAELMARWSMRETETAFDGGRSTRSPITYWYWNRKNTEREMVERVRFAICLIEDGTVIGANGLAGVDWINRTAETETEIVNPEFRYGGYGTEAKHLLLEYGFERLGLHMVLSQAWAFNDPSCAALRKQGYRDAGRMNWTGFKNGDFADDLMFDLLASEWRAARTTKN